jgi:hypothetical protein
MISPDLQMPRLIQKSQTSPVAQAGIPTAVGLQQLAEQLLNNY